MAQKYDENDGVWRTIGGRRVFIKNGQSLSDAMKESGKFKKKNQDNYNNKEYLKIEQRQHDDMLKNKFGIDKENMTKEQYQKSLDDYRKTNKSITESLKNEPSITERDAKDVFKQLNDEGSDFTFNEDIVIEDGKIKTNVGVFMPDERGYVNRELEIPLSENETYDTLEEKMRDWQSRHDSPDSFEDEDFKKLKDQNDYTKPSQEEEVERQRLISELRQNTSKEDYLDFIDQSTKKQISNDEIKAKIDDAKKEKPSENEYIGDIPKKSYDIADEIENKFGDKEKITRDEFEQYLTGKYDDEDADIRGILAQHGWETKFESDDEGDEGDLVRLKQNDTELLNGDTILDELGSDAEGVSAMYEKLGYKDEEIWDQVIEDADNEKLVLKHDEDKPYFELNKDGKTLTYKGRASDNMPIVEEKTSKFPTTEEAVANLENARKEQAKQQAQWDKQVADAKSTNDELPEKRKLMGYRVAENGKKELYEHTEQDDELGHWEKDKNGDRVFVKNPRYKETSNEQFEVSELKKKAQEVLPKEDIDTHEGDLYLKKTPKSEELIKNMKNADSGMLSTFRDQQTGETWYDIPFANWEDDYKEKTGRDWHQKDEPKTKKLSANSGQERISDNVKVMRYGDDYIVLKNGHNEKEFKNQSDAESYAKTLTNNDTMNDKIRSGASKVKKIPRNLSKDIYELDVDKGNAWSGDATTKNARGDEFVRVRRNGPSQNSSQDIKDAIEKKYPHLEGKIVGDNEVDFSVRKNNSQTNDNETMNDKIRTGGNKEDRKKRMTQSLAKMYDVDRATAERYANFPKDIQNIKKHGGAGKYDESEWSNDNNSMNDKIRNEAYNKYMKNHPNSKMTLEEFLKKKK